MALRDRMKPSVWGQIGVLVLLLIVTAVLAGALSSKNPRLGPWDEDAHIDYLVKIGRFHVPSSADVMDGKTIRIAVCRGFYGPYQPAGSCTDPNPIDPASYAFAGNSRAWTHPPVYYAITRVSMAPLQLVLWGKDFVDVARIASSLWTAVGLFLLWLVMRRARIEPLISASVLAILLTSQVVLERAMAISNDATAFFSGALLLALLVYRRGPVVLGIASALVMLMKAQNAVGIAAVLVACLLGVADGVARRRGESTDDDWRLRIKQAVGIVVGVGLGYLVWRVSQQTGASVVDSAGSTVNFAASPRLADVAALVSANVQAFATPLREYVPYLPTFVEAPYIPYVEFVATTAFLGVCVGGFLFVRESRLTFSASGSALAGVLLAPALLTLAIGFAIAVWAVWPARYGTAALPFLAFAYASAMGTGVGRVFTVALAVTSCMALAAAIVLTPGA